MRFLLTAIFAMLLGSVTGCFGGQGPSLLGQMPQGYDMYITIDPEVMDLAEILEALEDNLPEDALEKIEDINLELDPFAWDQWKEELGIQNGEIGVISLTEEEEIVAFFLPCGDGSKLEEFIEDNDFGDTEFFAYGDYTVMVVAWDDDDLLDDLEEALAGETLLLDPDFISMNNSGQVENSCINFFFSKEVTDVPIFGAFSSTSEESILKISVIADNEEIEFYLDVLGDGLQSDNIKFPENTMAAMRYNFNMDWLAQEYEAIAEKSGDNSLEEIESGLPFIGFSSLEEFISIFQGDFCISLQEIELDNDGEFETGQAAIAISLLDSETLSSSISMLSMIPEASIETFDAVTAYLIEESDQEFWVFIANDVLYVSMNADPDDILQGISAGDYFSNSIAEEGFMGGLVNPEAVMDGIDAEEDIVEIITALFKDRVEFSVQADGQMFTATTTAGPDVLKSFISLLGVIAASNGASSSYDMI